MPKEKIKELKLGDFKRTGEQGSFRHSFSWKNDEIEVCLDSCFNGYDVAIYDLNQDLIGKKTCTNIQGMLESQVAPGFSILTGQALMKAIKIANKKIAKLKEEK